MLQEQVYTAADAAVLAEAQSVIALTRAAWGL